MQSAGLADIFSQWFANPADPLLRAADIEQLAVRHSFSQYLCYETYDARRREYGNAGGTVGYIWECRPLAFLTGAGIGILGGMIGLGGAEFRLPLLIGVFGFLALQAVILNRR